MPLTQEQAELRAQSFKLIDSEKIKYVLYLKLNEDKYFDGQVSIIFELLQPSDHIFLDFAGKDLKSYCINQLVIDPSDLPKYWDSNYIKVPQSALHEGLNTITIEFTAEYVNDGYGLHKFVDTDGKIYLTSTMCPYNCNKVLPCFD